MNQTLYLLRQELGEEWIRAEGERLRVTGALAVDAIDFEKMVTGGSLNESLRLRWTPELNPGWIMVQAAEELQFHGFTEAAAEVLSRFDSWYGSLDAQQQIRPDLQSAAPESPVFLRFLGGIAARTGDPRTALAYSRELAAMDRDYLFGQHTLGRAAIAARLGEKDEAVALLRRAVSEGVRFGTNLHSDPDLLALRDYPPFQEFIRPDA